MCTTTKPLASTMSQLGPSNPVRMSEGTVLPKARYLFTTGG